MEEINNTNYLKKLLNGDISLFISFWIYFIFISFLIEFFFKIDLIQNSFIDLFLYSITLVYSILIFVIVYKSANKYLGSKIWSILAKTIVIINLFFSLTVLNDMIKYYFLEDYSIQKDINDFKSSLPIKIDSYTQLIDISKDDKTIFYVYKFYRKNFDSAFNNNKFKRKVQDSLCEDETTLNLLKKDYILDYKYINNEDKEIINILTDKDICGENIYDLDILKAILQARGEM